MNYEMGRETKEAKSPGKMLDSLLAEMGRLDAEMTHLKGQREKCEITIKETLQHITEAVAHATERT